MIKTIKIPEVRSIIIREPINIDEPIVLDDHIPYPKRATGIVQNTPVINYPTALNFTKRIGTVDYEVSTYFAEEGKSTLLSQFRDLILSQKLTDDLL